MPPIDDYIFQFPKGMFPECYYPFDENTRHVIFEKYPAYKEMKINFKDVDFGVDITSVLDKVINDDFTMSISMALMSWDNLINEQNKQETDGI